MTRFRRLWPYGLILLIGAGFGFAVNRLAGPDSRVAEPVGRAASSALPAPRMRAAPAP